MNLKKVLFGAVAGLAATGAGLGIKSLIDNHRRKKIEEEQARQLETSQKNVNEMLDLVIRDQEMIRKRQDEVDKAFEETLKQMSKRRKKEEEKIFNGPNPSEMKTDIDED